MVVDGLEPRAVERPSSETELARRLAEAAGDGQAVIPTGGGRLLGMGDPPDRFDLALETGGLAEITEQSTADMTVSAQAGVTLEQLNEQLGKGGQFLPLDPFATPGHTIGGLVATALSGPLRMRYGTLRDFLIGQWDYPMEQVHSAIDDHLEILAALEAGYADKAAALMLHHLTQSQSQNEAA